MRHQASRRVIAVGMTPAFPNASESAARSGLQIGANRITDRKHTIAANLRATRGLRHDERLFVDRCVRLAGIEHLSAERRINVGQRASTVDELLAALHHEVRIGAQHEHVARPHGHQQIPIVIRCFGIVVEETSADHEIGAIGRRKLQLEPLENRQVALGAEVIDCALPLCDDTPRHIARRHDGIIADARQAKLIEVVPDNRTWTRRVGDQDDRAASLTKACECVRRLRKRNDAVVHDAPDIAQEHIVAVGQQLEMVGK
jgi:hypothetical protein